MKLLKRIVSARNQIQIKEVKDGILLLPGNKYRLVLETSAVNFELKSEEEQDQIIDTFQNFLNSLPCAIQILVRTREIDIDGYLDEIKQKNDQETEILYKQQLEDYTQFIRTLVAGNKILTRKFYLVVTLTTQDKIQDFGLFKDQLFLKRDIVSKGLEKLGMKTRTLGNLELLDLFYSFYNPAHRKTQPLTQEAYDALFSTHYAL